MLSTLLFVVVLPHHFILFANESEFFVVVRKAHVYCVARVAIFFGIDEF